MNLLIRQLLLHSICKGYIFYWYNLQLKGALFYWCLENSNRSVINCYFPPISDCNSYWHRNGITIVMLVVSWLILWTGWQGSVFSPLNKIIEQKLKSQWLNHLLLFNISTGILERQRKFPDFFETGSKNLIVVAPGTPVTYLTMERICWSFTLATCRQDHSNSIEVSYLCKNKNSNLKAACHIKPKFFLWTRLLENLLAAKYLISFAVL